MCRFLLPRFHDMKKDNRSSDIIEGGYIYTYIITKYL